MRAIRVELPGERPASEIVARALELTLHGWARNDEDGIIRIHAEGEPEVLEHLVSWLGAAARTTTVKVEGHEQFAVRGVSAGVFVVQEHAATARHYDFRLEVDGVMRSWAVPKGPSLDPAVKRLAVQVEDHAMAHNEHEGPNVIVWDRGIYEQGGRVPWPQALDRGHAVFVLHGEKLHGGFALQRTRDEQWLLIKRRDEAAQPGSDITAERPESVASGRARL